MKRLELRFSFGYGLQQMKLNLARSLPVSRPLEPVKPRSFLYSTISCGDFLIIALTYEVADSIHDIEGEQCSPAAHILRRVDGFCCF